MQHLSCSNRCSSKEMETTERPAKSVDIAALHRLPPSDSEDEVELACLRTNPPGATRAHQLASWPRWARRRRHSRLRQQWRPPDERRYRLPCAHTYYVYWPAGLAGHGGVATVGCASSGDHLTRGATGYHARIYIYIYTYVYITYLYRPRARQGCVGHVYMYMYVFYV